ncbi:MAG: membrane integrity-associated transporter subunit PqiC [Desulfuromonadaceae bacterium]|nr:membrane integrity-associated transporter subunit PqiC [Desulfuromonadaceae bacterium]
MNKAAFSAWILLVACLVGSCTLLPQSQPATIYQLPAATDSVRHAVERRCSLRIDSALASGVLTSSRMIVAHDNTLSAYPGIRWNAPIPVLWRDYLLEAFQRDGRIAHLSSDDETLAVDYALSNTLQSFQCECQGKTIHVLIRLDARLVDVQSKRIIASRQFSAWQPLAGEQPPQIVAAFGQVSAQLSRDLIDWTVQNIALTPQVVLPEHH